MSRLPNLIAAPLDSVMTLLPGPDRKRAPAAYRYRVVYRTAEPEAAGCVLLWEVVGGRLPYQIAMERDAAGNLRLHCTCADAVFRAEDEGRFCKHIRGLLHLGQPEYPCPQTVSGCGASA